MEDMNQDMNSFQTNQFQPQQNAPVKQLKTNRSMIKLILLSIVTFGIYSIVTMTGMANDLNLAASKYDGKKTMHYCLLFFLIGVITLGIATLVWYTKFCGRIGAEEQRRGLPVDINGGTFWLWGILGSLILVGPFIFVHKMCKGMNAVNADYNIHG